MSNGEERRRSCGCESGEYVPTCSALVDRYLDENDDDAKWTMFLRLRSAIQWAIAHVLRGQHMGVKRERTELKVIQKLCDRSMVDTFRCRPTLFCAWLHVIATNAAIDEIRPSPDPTEIGIEPPLDLSDPNPGPDPTSALSPIEASDLLFSALLTLKKDWQVAFAFRYSYFAATNEEIARRVNLEPNTICGWFSKLLSELARQCAKLARRSLDEVRELLLSGPKLIGEFHPVRDFVSLTKKKQDSVNRHILQLLESYPLEQQLAYCLRYCPLAATNAMIAKLLRGDTETVERWIREIDAQVRNLPSTDSL